MGGTPSPGARRRTLTRPFPAAGWLDLFASGPAASPPTTYPPYPVGCSLVSNPSYGKFSDQFRENSGELDSVIAMFREHLAIKKEPTLSLRPSASGVRAASAACTPMPCHISASAAVPITVCINTYHTLLFINVMSLLYSLFFPSSLPSSHFFL